MKAIGIDLTKEIFDKYNPQYMYDLYFFPTDYGCRVFDFYREDDIRIYNGVLPFKKEVIKIITRDEFEKEYGKIMFYDIHSYKVNWIYSCYTWNN